MDKKKHLPRHNYHDPCIYAISVITVDRNPILGTIVGNAESATCELSPIGQAVKEETYRIPEYCPQACIHQCVVMPDHVHFVINVMSPISCSLGEVVASWKAHCSRRAQQLLNNTTSDKTPYQPLFANGYSDTIIHDDGQFLRMTRFLEDNPRRILIQKQNPEYFTIRRNIDVYGHTVDAIGNLDLLKKPLIAVHCRSRWQEDETVQYALRCLQMAKLGCVMIGAFISQAEQEIGIEAAANDYPIIHLMKNGFHELYKPLGHAFYACAEGRLLHLTPWQYHVSRQRFTREQCVTLNTMAEDIAAAVIRTTE